MSKQTKKSGTKASKTDKVSKPKKAECAEGLMSGLDATAKILAEAKEPLDTKTMVERAISTGIWKTEGKTPHATMFAAILREIKKKGDQSRFRKSSRGKFELTA